MSLRPAALGSGLRRVYLKGGPHVCRPRDRNYLIIQESFEDAVEKGIDRAVKTLKNVEGAWIQEQKIVVEGGKIAAYRVNMKVTFVLQD